MKKMTKAIIAITSAIAVFGGASAFAVNSYINTHSWATIMWNGVIDDETCDAVEQEDEVLKGDRLSLLCGAAATIDHVSHDGTVRLTFSPPVTGTDGAVIETAELGSDPINICLDSDGGTASMQLRVTSHRYQ